MFQRSLVVAAAVVAIAPAALAQEAYSRPGEEPVDPYEVSDANAGAAPFTGTEMFAAFHGQPGIDRIVADMLARAKADPRIAGIFVATDMVRLDRTLKEQFCHILGGGCAYSGRSMETAHADLGLQPADMGALVEHLQDAMAAEGVAFGAQNRFLAKLAPMRREIVTR